MLPREESRRSKTVAACQSQYGDTGSPCQLGQRVSSTDGVDKPPRRPDAGARSTGGRGLAGRDRWRLGDGGSRRGGLIGTFCHVPSRWRGRAAPGAGNSRCWLRGEGRQEWGDC
jgi:hypothetical protein